MYENGTNDFMNGFVLGRDNGNNNNDGFGGSNGAWWLIIILLFAFGGFGGWNRGGWGGNNGGGSNGGGGYVSENYVLASDNAAIARQLSDGFATLERKGDAINNGLCDGFYSQAQLINGVQQSLATQGFETRNAVQAAQVAGMSNTNAIQSQLADCCCKTQSGLRDVSYNVATNANNIVNAINQCCCDNKSAIADVNYNIATQTNGLQRSIDSNFASASYQRATDTCAINTNIANATRDIVDSQNANTRSILDALTAQRIADKDAQISAQAQQISALQLAASQQAQNAYLINQLRPCPTPAYVVPNPYCNCNCGNNTAAAYGVGLGVGLGGVTIA